MRSWILVWLIGGLMLSGDAAAERVGDLAAPLPASYVLDTGQHLAADTRAELDRIAAVLDDAGTGQLAFVVIESTDGADPRGFATALMNRWGVGHAEQDDGTLFLIARADRAAEIVLGDGIDNAANRAHAQSVMDTIMIPRLRNGDADQALVAGATTLLQSIYSIDLSRPNEAPADVAENSNTQATPLMAARATRIDSSGARSLVEQSRSKPSSAFIAGALTVAAGSFAFVLWVIWKILSSLWSLVASTLIPRRCGACKSKMNALSEVEDDAHLAAGELTEEHLKSVNHRVFLCPHCHSVEKIARRAWFTRYAPCRQCLSRAVSRNSVTISAATRYSTGIAEITENCQHCQHTSKSRRTLPILPPPSSSSSSRSRSSSGGSRSYGGGRSSGGGASGRW